MILSNGIENDRCFMSTYPISVDGLKIIDFPFEKREGKKINDIFLGMDVKTVTRLYKFLVLISKKRDIECVEESAGIWLCLNAHNLNVSM